MLLSGTVVADATTVIHDGGVVVDGTTIEAVGSSDELSSRYPDHDVAEYDLLLPGLVAGHVHSVQSLGRGLADDVELMDWLYDHILPMEAALTDTEMEIAARLGYLELIENGVTTCIDHLSVRHAERAFEAAGEMGIRARLGKVLMDNQAPEGLEQDADTALAESRRLIERYHGAYDDRLRYAVTPRHAVSCTEACLRGARALADEYDGVRIHTHASESRNEVETVQEETGLRNISWLDEVGLTGEDVVLAHCVWTDERERELLAETGTHVAHCPTANMKLASGAAPIPEYRDRGINVAIGNDGAPANNTLDPFTEMKQATLLQKVEHLDATTLPADDVFEMATINGAKAAGFERVGALREGWRADVIGLRTDLTRATPLRDVRSHLVFAAHGDDVVFTMVNGDVLMADGEVTVVDAEQVRQSAARVASELSTA